MKSPKLRTILTASVASVTLFTGFALAAGPTMEPCPINKTSTLLIHTDTTSGWTVSVNGGTAIPAVAVAQAGWVAAPASSSWIGVGNGNQAAGTYTYKVSFNTPFMHGPMRVQAQWLGDNCGTSMQAGTGAPALAPALNTPSAPCYSTDKDFLHIHTTPWVNFAPGDSNNTSSSITFTVTNEAGGPSPEGFAATFTVVAECTCKPRGDVKE